MLLGEESGRGRLQVEDSNHAILDDERDGQFRTDARGEVSLRVAPGRHQFRFSYEKWFEERTVQIPDEQANPERNLMDQVMDEKLQSALAAMPALAVRSPEDAEVDAWRRSVSFPEAP